MRDKIYDIIKHSHHKNKIGEIYDHAIMAVIILSLVPLAFKEKNTLFYVIEYFSLTVFIIDYLLRIIVADKKIKKGKLSFLIYPFTPFAIIDLIAILPSLTAISKSLKLLKMVKLARVLRVLKFLRYSKSFEIIANVFKKQKRILLAVGAMTVSYIIASALVIYNVEPDSFNNFFDALYWATMSLTTVGHSELHPVTTIGRAVTMLSSIVGLTVVALPTGAIAAGFISHIKNVDDDERDVL